jgi:acyl transferase domain-containing protein
MPNQSKPAQLATMSTYLFVLSAHDQDGIARIAESHMQYLQTRAMTPLSLRNYAYTLYERRSRFQYRAYAVADSQEKLILELQKLYTSEPTRSASPKDVSLAFVFCGQGAQWPAMGLELCSLEPYRRSLEDASRYLKRIDGYGFNLLGMLRRSDKAEIYHPQNAQAATTALQVALVDLLLACNIRPVATVGHSSGEIAAAYAAGLISQETAWKLAYYRGKVAASITRVGAMLAVGLSENNVQKYINRVLPGSVCIACVNSPESVTLSGDEDQILSMLRLLQQDGIPATQLHCSTAYHSHHMKEASKDYLEHIKDLRTLSEDEHGGVVTMYSSVTGKRVEGHQLIPSYWARNMEVRVEFEKAVNIMMEDTSRESQRPSIFLELSPHSILRKPLRDIITKMGIKSKNSYLPAMVRHNNAIHTLLKTIGEIWSHGYSAQLGWLFCRY